MRIRNIPSEIRWCWRQLVSVLKSAAELEMEAERTREAFQHTQPTELEQAVDLIDRFLVYHERLCERFNTAEPPEVPAARVWLDRNRKRNKTGPKP